MKMISYLLIMINYLLVTMRNLFLTIMFFVSFFVCGIIYVLARIFYDRKKLLNLERRLSKIILYCAGQKLKVVGNIPDPASGPYIYMANHLSYLDGFIMIAGLNDTFAPIVASKYYYIPFLHGIFVFLGAIRAQHLDDTVNEAISVMESQKSILIFPEGRRSVDGELQELKPGILKLAKSTNLPIVTCFILNANLAWNCHRLLIRPKTLVLAIGRPISMSQLKKIYDFDGIPGEEFVALRRLFTDQEIDALNAEEDVLIEEDVPAEAEDELTEEIEE